MIVSMSPIVAEDKMRNFVVSRGADAEVSRLIAV